MKLFGFITNFIRMRFQFGDTASSPISVGGGGGGGDGCGCLLTIILIVGIAILLSKCSSP